MDAAPSDEFRAYCRATGWSAVYEGRFRALAKNRGMEVLDLVKWVHTLDLATLQLADLEAFLTVAELTRSAHLLLEAAQKYNLTVAGLLTTIEAQAGKPVGQFDQGQIDSVLDRLDRALAETHKPKGEAEQEGLPF